MEPVESETKRRVLPSWMTAQAPQERVVPVKTPKRKRMVEPAMAARRHTARTVYCMNEAELVDVALGVLIEGRTQGKPREEPAVTGAEKTELCPEGPGSPHTSSGGSSEEEDSGKEGPAPSLSPSRTPGASTSACSRSPEREEQEQEQEQEQEDAFKYVREIFFS